MSSAADYIAAALIVEVRRNDEKLSGTSPEQFAGLLKERYGFELKEVQINAALRRLAELGLVALTEDEYAGSFLRFPSATSLEIRIGNLKNKQPDARFFRALGGGEKLLERAFANAKFWRDFDAEVSTDSTSILSVPSPAFAPASDRIVTLSHNQYAALSEPLDDVIEAVEQNNGIPEEPGFRERVLGQLKAGREFLKAGVFEGQLFYYTLVVGLKMLAEKYKDHAVAALASELVDLILQHLGELVK